MKSCLYFLLFVFTSFEVKATVDVQNGNFFYSFVDGELSSPSASWQVQRSYNSRSNRIGIFGWGWCSPLETNLEIYSEKELRLQNCGSGSISKFLLKSEGHWTNGNESLVLDKKTGYIFKKNDISQLQFNLDGKLVKFWLGMNRASINYVKDRLGSITIDDKTVKFELNDNGNVVKVQFPDGKSSRFSYENKNLTTVDNAWGSRYEYKYDSQHNLVKATWPDKTTMELAYEATKDWVKSFKEG